MNYIRDAWYVGAWSDDVGAERPLGLRICDEPIVAWRTSTGTLVCFEDRCIHRLAPLSLGRCEGDRLRCMYHGLLFDQTGRAVEIPGQGEIPTRARVRAYPTAERFGFAWVWMGDPARADEALIPALLGMDREDYVYGRGHIDYEAEARFVCENLLDLSHLSFLHVESFGMSGIWAEEQPKVTEGVRSVRSERWIRNLGFNGAANAETRIDTYFCYDFYVPGALLMTSRVCPVGSADALQGRAPDQSQPIAGFTTQAITPTTEKTSRYFYIAGQPRQANQTSYDLTVMEKAFAEDRSMIEGQQRIVEATPGWRFMPIVGDRGVLAYNRLTDKLRRSEEGPAKRNSSASASQ